MSFAERKTKIVDTSAAVSHLVEGGRLMRDIDRPPGDVVSRERKPQHQQQQQSTPKLAKKRSNFNFFEDAFSVHETSPAKEKVRGDAIVMAEVKTNVIISDEFTFITDLSYHLSTRYQRPVSSIVVNLQHGVCMLFGGNFDPAYTMAIFALPSHILPTTNKRNAALIQKHMEEAIGVVPARGLLRFVPTSEEHMANNGKTMAGEIDELEKNYGASQEKDENSTGSIVRRGSKATRRKLSVKSMASFRPSTANSAPAAELTPPSSANEPLPTVPGSPTIPAQPSSLRSPTKPTDHHRPPDPPAPPPLQKTARRKKSFVATMFGRSSSTAKPDYRPSLAAVSGE
ncbi:Tautomerase/MIF superfamily [Bombardia bombarda]|uniref:L-dopachrome isomerase n=1 Tax=Bombardia bombarda TaxID=252184 RepID=A0AA39WTI7_9PEZI|nr:Tautomerase/MIF superfamily [Bombardia bombarda]